MTLTTDEIDERELQLGLANRLGELGWEFAWDETLDRPIDDVLRFSDIEAALIRLNPEIAQDPTRVEQVFAKLRAILLAVENDGLVTTNQEFVAWMRGLRSVKYMGESKESQVRLIDFDDMSNNVLRCTVEATFSRSADHKNRRYDIVLWINGLPVVVGETKSPKNANLSWLNGATDIYNGYEVKTKQFFVPNVLSFATEGREFRYGAIRQSPEMWLNWAKTTDPMRLPGLPAVLRSLELLLTPQMVLDILRTFTLYAVRPTSSGAVKFKIIPRYPQVEAVDAILARCKDPKKRQGLIWHHQGSGKTFAMAFAAAKLRQQMDMNAPAIVVVLDRLDLIQQTVEEFSSAGVFGMQIAETKESLQKMLQGDVSGVIVTTIFRFAQAGELNTRSNIVVMVDEAHRTQEGRLGLDMRAALPNAKFIGLTGTPISTSDRNTWEMFGDPDDPDGALNHYSVERSIYDGATLPVHIETRLVNFHFDKDALQAAFDKLAEEESLTDDQAGKLAAKASHLSVVVKDPDRIKAVCQDIVTHYRNKVEKLGLKAQVVAFDREACVAYYEAISALLHPGEEATIVMTTDKDDPESWERWDIDRNQEAIIKRRFRDVDDSLKFVIVTAKLLTGFDAPIEGVMYLDKPLRAHTLFQAVCRTNRRWTNPRTGQEKLHGLIVDYVGLGEELAKAVAIKPRLRPDQNDQDVTVLMATLRDEVTLAVEQFAHIDRTRTTFEQIHDAQQVLDTKEKRNNFAGVFLTCQGLFEFLWPDPVLTSIENNYKFLARIYDSIKPSKDNDLLLWHRLGAKTIAIVHEHLHDVTIDGKQLESVALDAEFVHVLESLGWQIATPPEKPKPAPSAQQVLDRLAERIRLRLQGDGHKVWISLSERLELLRAKKLGDAQASVDFLKELLQLAKDLLAAEKADEEGNLDDIKVIDPRTGALTQIFNEFAPENTPVIIETVVEKVDALVQPVRGTGWQTSTPGDKAVRRNLRIVLHECGLPLEGDLFSHAYAYIRENY